MGILLSKDIDFSVLQEFRDANILSEDIQTIYDKYNAFQKRRIRNDSRFGTELDLNSFANLIGGEGTQNAQKYKILFQRWSKKHDHLTAKLQRRQCATASKKPTKLASNINTQSKTQIQSMLNRKLPTKMTTIPKSKTNTFNKNGTNSIQISQTSRDVTTKSDNKKKSEQFNINDKKPKSADTSYVHASNNMNQTDTSELADTILDRLQANRTFRKKTQQSSEKSTEQPYFDATETVNALEFFVAWTLLGRVDSAQVDSMHDKTVRASVKLPTIMKLKILLKYFDCSDKRELTSLVSINTCVEYVINALIKLHNLHSIQSNMSTYAYFYNEATKLIVNSSNETLSISKYKSIKLTRGNVAIWAMTNPIVLKILNLHLITNVHNISQFNQAFLASIELKWLLNSYHGTHNASKIIEKMRYIAQHFDPMIDHFDYVVLRNGDNVPPNHPNAMQPGSKRVIFDLHFNPFLTLKHNIHNSKLLTIHSKLGNKDTQNINFTVKKLISKYSDINLHSILQIDEPQTQSNLAHGFKYPYETPETYFGSISTTYSVSMDSQSSTISIDRSAIGAYGNGDTNATATAQEQQQQQSFDAASDMFTVNDATINSNNDKQSQIVNHLIATNYDIYNSHNKNNSTNNDDDNEYNHRRKHKFRKTLSHKSASSSILEATTMTKGDGTKHDGSIVQHYDAIIPFDSPPIKLFDILSSFDKHLKLAMKVQSEIRSPEMVTPDTIKAIMRAFQSLARGSEYISKDDFVNKFYAVNANKEQKTSEKKRNYANTIRHSKVTTTLSRIFDKCDDDHTSSVDINEFLIHQFENANKEEVERAIAFTKPVPQVKAWAARYIKILFEKLAHTYPSNRRLYAKSKKKFQDDHEERFIVDINENEPFVEKNSSTSLFSGVAHQAKFFFAVGEQSSQYQEF